MSPLPVKLYISQRVITAVVAFGVNCMLSLILFLLTATALSNDAVIKPARPLIHLAQVENAPATSTAMTESMPNIAPSTLPPLTVFEQMSVVEIAPLEQLELPINSALVTPKQPQLSDTQNGGVRGAADLSLPSAQPVMQMPPVYPIAARQRGIEGFVELHVAVNQQGRVEQLAVVDEQPAGIFTRSASQAVMRWTFIAPEQQQWQKIVVRYEIEK